MMGGGSGAAHVFTARNPPAMTWMPRIAGRTGSDVMEMQAHVARMMRGGNG